MISHVFHQISTFLSLNEYACVVRDRPHSSSFSVTVSSRIQEFSAFVYGRMSSKVDEVEEEKKRLRGYLNENAVDVKDLASWRKQSEEILLMRLLSPDLARARRGNGGHANP